MPDNPCKSPDCPPEPDRGPSDENTKPTTVWPLRRCFGVVIGFETLGFLRTAFAFKAGCLGAGFFFFFTDFFLDVALFFASLFVGFIFLPADRFAGFSELDFVCFFLPLFFAAIGEVYHRQTRSTTGTELARHQNQANSASTGPVRIGGGTLDGLFVHGADRRIWLWIYEVRLSHIFGRK
jgi:hypothetical protein